VFLGEVASFPPEETQQIPVFFLHFHLVEHALYVTHERDRLLSKAAKYAGQIVRQVRALEQVLV